MLTSARTRPAPDADAVRAAGLPEPSSRDRLAVAILAAAVLTFAAAAYPYAHFPFAGEHGLYSYGAWRLSEGDVIYRDFSTQDGPGIYLLHRVAHGLFGWDVGGLRRFDLVWFAAILLVLHRVAASVSGRRGAALAVLLAIPAYFGFGYRATAQRDSFALLPILLALVAARGWGHTRRRDFLLSVAIGALASLACSLKPPIGLVPGLLLLVPGRAPEGRVQAVAVRAVGMAAGFLLASAPWLWYFAVHHAFSYAYESLVLFNLRYAAERYPVGVQVAYALRAAPALPWTACGAVGCLALGWRDAASRRLALVTVGLAAVVLAQGKLLDYHAVPLNLVLCLWSAAAVVSLARRGARVRGGSVAAAALAVGLAAMGVRTLVEARYVELWRDRLAGHALQLQREDMRLGAFLGERTPPDETLLVWGIESPGVINFVARRRAPTRFLTAYLFSLDRAPDEQERSWRREYMAALRARPPRWVVVMGNDAFPGINNLDSRVSFARFGELQAFVARGYEPAGSLQGRFSYQLYRRREAPPEASPAP